MSSLFLGKNPFRWLVQTIQAQGPLRAFKVLWHSALDAPWDFIHGTETLTRILPQNLETDSSNKVQATCYGAVRARPFMHLLRKLNLPTAGAFVDLGCGKGRAILIAAQCGFQKVVGVDFSEPLCRLARHNVVAFGRRRKLKSEIIIVHADVVHYAIQSDQTTFFLFDPFNAEVLTQVLQNLRQSLLAHPRDIWVIYASPVCHDLVERCGLFTDKRLFEIGCIEFRVYGNAPIPGLNRFRALDKASTPNTSARGGPK